MRRTAAAAALALLALAAAPALRPLLSDAAAQDKEKDKQKEEERKKKEEEERKKREKARLEKAILAIANGFGAEDLNAVLLNVPDSATVALRLSDADKKPRDYSKEQARGVLDGFFREWRIIRVDTSSISVDQNVASFPLGLFKDSEKDTKVGKRLRIKVGSAEDKHPLVKLVVEW